jgi:hypothetical protein
MTSHIRACVRLVMWKRDRSSRFATKPAVIGCIVEHPRYCFRAPSPARRRLPVTCRLRPNICVADIGDVRGGAHNSSGFVRIGGDRQDGDAGVSDPGCARGRHISGRAGMQSLGMFQFFGFKIFRAELSSSSESFGSLFFTARDSIIAPTNPLNKAIACCLASCSSPPNCAAIISK